MLKTITDKVDWVNAHLNELNKNYHGTFRALTDKERKELSEKLNQNGSEWYEPYAYREETHDVVSRYDSQYSSGDFLFTKINSSYLNKVIQSETIPDKAESKAAESNIKWKVYSNPINGEIKYIAGRQIDLDKPLYSGNFECHGNYTKDKNAVEKLCDELNKKENLKDKVEKAELKATEHNQGRNDVKKKTVDDPIR